MEQVDVAVMPDFS